jgi:hypothetical protein
LLERLPLDHCSDDFAFDNQTISLALHSGFRVGEISCPTRYFREASTINLRRSIVYGVGVLRTAVQYRLDRAGIHHTHLFNTPHARGGPVMLTRPSLAVERLRQD